MKTRRLVVAAALTLCMTAAQAAEIGHFAPGVPDAVDAAGLQVGLTHVPGKWALNFHYFYEFDAEDRFQGQSIGLNFGIKF